MPENKRKMTVKQEKFVAEYIANDGNGTQAALAAYNPSNHQTAGAMAYETLQIPHVMAAINDKRVRLLESLSDKIRESGLLEDAIARAKQLIASPDEAIARDGIRLACELAKLMQSPSSATSKGPTHAHLHLPKR